MRGSGHQHSVFKAEQNNPYKQENDHMGGALTRNKSRDTRIGRACDLSHLNQDEQ